MREAAKGKGGEADGQRTIKHVAGGIVNNRVSRLDTRERAQDGSVEGRGKFFAILIFTLARL
jgi:hypothetical protein